MAFRIVAGQISAQVTDALPAIAARPVWDQFEDSVDCFSFLRRPLLHCSQKHLVNSREASALLITPLSRSLGHSATSPQTTAGASFLRDTVQCTGHESSQGQSLERSWQLALPPR